jgi:hypothetical protein
VLGLSFRISNLVPPRTARISCPFVPENEPTAAVEMAVGAWRVRLRRCILLLLPRALKQVKNR